MPVLKVNVNGEWKDIASTYSHSHTVSDITDLPASLVDDIEALKDKVGANSVAYQVSTAIEANTYQHPYTHPATMITGLADVAISGSYNDLTDLPEMPSVQVQADWNQTDDTAADYIKNKPDGLATETYVHEEIAKVDVEEQLADYALKSEIPNISGLATETYVQEEISKIEVSGGTSEQVQADWDETDTTSPAYIKNKPSISSDGSVSMQANWNQNDEAQTDYIKNRPFYDGGTILTEVFPETTIPFNFDSSMGIYMFYMTPTSEQLGIWNDSWTEMTVVWDGVTYVSQAQYIDGDKVIGNLPIFMGTGNTNEPFIMTMSDSICMIASLFDGAPEDPSTAETKYHSISLSCEMPQIIKVPTKYLYQPDWEEIDEDNGSYIKNKPFGVYRSGTVLFDGELSLYNSQTSEDGTVTYMYIGAPNIPVIPADYHMLDLIVDGVEYSNTVTTDSSQAVCTYELNDGSTMTVYIMNGQIGVATQLSEAPTIMLALCDNEYVKIPSEYLPAQLPIITNDDNGKILTAYYGNWLPQAPASGLPDVTAFDDGKVLKVVNGAWAVTQELPTITEDDNGKVLAVSDGAWTVASSLPTVTADDAGKFLRVSADGLWVVESVPNAEEASF